MDSMSASFWGKISDNSTVVTLRPETGKISIMTQDEIPYRDKAGKEAVVPQLGTDPSNFEG